jgi:hypothetical protein
MTWTSLANVASLKTEVGIPQVASVNGAQYNPRFDSLSFSPFLGDWIKLPKPNRVVLHDFRASVGAKDMGGTTDAYVRVWFNTLNTKAGALVREAFETEISRSEVLKKHKCPDIVSWPTFSVVLPIESMVGTIPNCIVTVRDKDWGFGAVSDDTILRHSINLTEFAYGRFGCERPVTDQFCVTPDWVDEINDTSSNRGFTRAMVALMYKVTLLYPNEEASVHGFQPSGAQPADSGVHVAAEIAAAPDKKKGYWS